MEDLRKLLRQGYVVEHMDGELSKVEMNAGKQLIISGEHRWFPIENLTEQLEYICYFTNDKDYAPKVKIKAIYGLAETNCKAFKLSTDDRETIWAREEGKEFNWEEFKASDKIAVHCKTEEEATDFCKQMHEHGLEWSTGDSYLFETKFENYEENTCYTSHGTFASKEYCKSNNYTILEWSNYMNKEKENSMNLEFNNLTEEQKNQIIELAKKFEQENEVDKLDYYHDWKVYSCSGNVGEACMANMELIQDLFNLGLTAHTKEETEKIRRRLLVEKELRDWAKKCKEPVDIGNTDQEKYYVQYETDCCEISTEGYYTYVVANILFTDESILKKAIESIGQERLIRDYFGIDK